MNENERDINLLKNIIRYCDEINAAVLLFGKSYDLLLNNSIYINAVSMCVLQIGEFTGNLSESLKNMYNKMPWKQIKGMRNIVVHNYGNLDTKELWYTISEDIPALKSYCEYILSEITNGSQHT